MLLLPFLTLGMGQAIVKFLAGQHDKERIREDFFSCIFMVLITSFCAALIVFAFSGATSVWIFGSQKYALYAKLLAIMIVLESVNFIFIEFFKAFRYIAVYSCTFVIEAALEIGLIAYATLNGYGILGAVICLLAVRASFVATRAAQAVSRVGFSFPAFVRLREYVAFGIPFVFSVFFFFILNWGNRYFINYFLGLSDVGKYSVAYFLAYMVTIIAMPIGYILLPTLSSCVNKSEFEQAALYLKYSLKYFVVAGLPLVLLISLYSGELLTLFSTKDFLSGQSCLPLLSAAFFILQLGAIGEYVNMVFGKNMIILRVYIILAFVNIILNVALIPFLGVKGAALALLISFIGYSAFNLRYSQRFVRFKIELSMISKVAVSALCMALSLIVFQRTVRAVNPIFFAPAGLAIYMLLLLALGCFTKNEILLFKSIVLSKKGS
jgi:O-antigen/teichoic acid export membrane protein